jgi:hypothetical protein
VNCDTKFFQLAGLIFVETGNIDCKPRRHPCDVETVNLSIAYIAALLENVKDAHRLSLIGALKVLQQIEEKEGMLKLTCNLNTLVLAAIRATIIKSDRASRVHHFECDSSIILRFNMHMPFY